MSYKVGDMVVYPRHGAAKVEAITERTVKGVTREYLQLSVLSSDGLVINVPVDNAKKVGVRDIVSASEVAKVFGILRTPIIEKEMNWSRRYKLNVEKIATGDVNKIAEVVRESRPARCRRARPVRGREAHAHQGPCHSRLLRSPCPRRSTRRKPSVCST